MIQLDDTSDGDDDQKKYMNDSVLEATMCIDYDDEDNIPLIHLRNGNHMMYAEKMNHTDDDLDGEVRSCEGNDNTCCLTPRGEPPTVELPAFTETQPQMADFEETVQENFTTINLSLSDSIASNTLSASPSEGLSTVTSPLIILPVKIRQSRKRSRNDDVWRINMRKRLRNKGESYVKYNRKEN